MAVIGVEGEGGEERKGEEEEEEEGEEPGEERWGEVRKQQPSQAAAAGVKFGSSFSLKGKR